MATKENPDAPSDFWQHQSKEDGHTLNRNKQKICTIRIDQQDASMKVNNISEPTFA